ncbi:hypothetical protein [Pedobacter sp. WC2423]|uniref:hypothetical protein n=1 Tax=Pedobacter sp. WC2423 TaxID=3234142 RepID=UPI00346631AE
MKNFKSILTLACVAVLPIALFSFKSPKISETETAISKVKVVTESAKFIAGDGVFTSSITKNTDLSKGTTTSRLVEAKVTNDALVELNDNSIDRVLNSYE